MSTEHRKFLFELPQESEEEQKEEIYERMREAMSKFPKVSRKYSTFLNLLQPPSVSLREMGVVELEELERPSESDILKSDAILAELRGLRAVLMASRAEGEKLQALITEALKRQNPGGKTGFFTLPDFPLMLGTLIGGFGLICTGILTDESYYSVMGALLILVTFLHLGWLLKESKED